MASSPAVFLGHGSPMNTLETNRFTRAWRAFGQRVGRPRAVVVISAHWYIGATAVTAMARPRTIHDFSGFPDALRRFRYPAPGSPEVAQEVAAALAPTPVKLDERDWGLDHGTWSVLAHVFPRADVPVVQLSIDATRPLADHLAWGRALEPLRQEGILILGSGNVVHHLGRIDWSQPEGAKGWNRSFDLAAREIMTQRPGDLGELRRHTAWDLAVPTPEHFLPLAYIAGVADAAGRGAEVLVEGYAYGSLSMTSYEVAASHG